MFLSYWLQWSCTSISYVLYVGLTKYVLLLPVQPVHVRGIQEVVLLFVSADVLHDVWRHDPEGWRGFLVRLVADETVVLRRAVTVRVISVLIHGTLCHYNTYIKWRIVCKSNCKKLYGIGGERFVGKMDIGLRSRLQYRSTCQFVLLFLHRLIPNLSIKILVRKPYYMGVCLVHFYRPRTYVRREVMFLQVCVCSTFGGRGVPHLRSGWGGTPSQV